MTEGAPWLSAGRLAVLGTGVAVPGPALSTENLIAAMVERFGFTRSREAAAIAERLGIRSRHVCRALERQPETARPGQSNPELAAAAVRAALAGAGLAIGDLGYLVAHTTTPATLLPANVAAVADLLGYAGPHIELRQACTGFANALMVAFGLLSSASGRPVALVGSETGSLFLDPASLARDTSQIVNLLQMGDGAAAIVLGTAGQGGAEIGGAWFGTVGLGRSPGISLAQGADHFAHDFTAIRASGHLLFEAGAAAAQAQGCALEDAQFIVPHQVSGRIGEQLSDHFGVAREKVFVHADRLGNTGSAAIWMALAVLRSSGLARGDRVLALGAEASKHMYGGFIYDHG